MKQVLQSLKTGDTLLADVPAPLCRQGQVLIATRASLISAGTERMLVEFGQANLIQKALSQPERVRQVVDKVRTDGISPTLDAVFSKLDEPLPLGYCNAGVVLEVGNDVDGFARGDHVVSNGPHAEIISIPRSLCARIPNGVEDETAAFTVLASIGLQGIRLAAPTLGESFVVVGLGLIGLLTVQMLIANGCRVLGIDFDEHKLELACGFGAQTVNLSAGVDPVAAGLAFSGGRGVDAVLITASTKSSDPVHQAAQMSRKRGRIILIGVTGLSLSRADFYEKELIFQVSCSYGPGRYDEQYEQGGHDYPFGLVRWTEQRNFEAVLQLMASGKLDVSRLITHQIPQSEAPKAYELLTNGASSLGIVLTYPTKDADLRHTIPVARYKAVSETQVTVGMIGAGSFGARVLLPALKRTPAALKSVASATGISSALAAQRFGFQYATSDYHAIIDDSSINTIIVATPHNTHAQMVVEALRSGKHVFVEKPLAINREELKELEAAIGEKSDKQLVVGFNRRFSPLSVRLKAALANRTQPCSLIYTVNAGFIPPEHWTQNKEVGGGRIIGEACHFIDLLLFLIGSPITGVEARMMGRASGVAVSEDKMAIFLNFEDGSTGVVHYLANGSKSFPKERLEVFSEGRIAVLDNFKSLRGFGWKGLNTIHLRRQDKGHQAEIAAFIQRIIEGGEWLIPWRDLRDVTLATFAAVERAHQSLRGLDHEVLRMDSDQ